MAKRTKEQQYAAAEKNLREANVNVAAKTAALKHALFKQEAATKIFTEARKALGLMNFDDDDDDVQ